MRNFKLVSQNNIKEFLQKVTEDNDDCVYNSDYYEDHNDYDDYDYYDAGPKLRGYRRRTTNERFRGQRDNQPGNRFHRDPVHYTWESRHDHQESVSRMIQRGYAEYLDDMEAEAKAKAEAKAEAEAKADLLEFLKQERDEALGKALKCIFRVFELNQAITGLGLEE